MILLSQERLNLMMLCRKKFDRCDLRGEIIRLPFLKSGDIAVTLLPTLAAMIKYK